jgi:hypothetical protein
MAGAWRIGTARARAAGLRCRPAAETVADVAAWLRDGGEAELSDWGSHARPAPMSAEREAELLTGSGPAGTRRRRDSSCSARASDTASPHRRRGRDDSR